MNATISVHRLRGVLAVAVLFAGLAAFVGVGEPAFAHGDQTATTGDVAAAPAHHAPAARAAAGEGEGGLTLTTLVQGALLALAPLLLLFLVLRRRARSQGKPAFGVRSALARPTRSELGLAAALAVGVVGMQHQLHVEVLGHAVAGGLAHFARDAAAALPVGLLALRLGSWLTAGAARAAARPRDRAAAVSLAFTALLLPGTVIHQALESLGGTSHAQHQAGAIEGTGTAVGLALHGLRDALIGQLAAFPIALLAFVIAGSGGQVFVRRPRRPVRARLVLTTTLAAGGLLLTGSLGAFAGSDGAARAKDCSEAPKRTYNVSAINVQIQYSRWGIHDPIGYMYVLDEQIDEVRAQEAKQPGADAVSVGLRGDAIQPLVLRANLGECLVVNFTNRIEAPEKRPADRSVGPMPGDRPRISIQPVGLPYDVSSQRRRRQSRDPFADQGETVQYRFFMDPALGEGAHVFQTGGDARALTSHGLFGSIIAEPRGSVYRHPDTGRVVRRGKTSGWEAVIDPPSGPTFREFALMYHDVGDEFFNMRAADGSGQIMLDDQASDAYRPGTRAINYRSEAFKDRLDLGANVQQAAEESPPVDNVPDPKLLGQLTDPNVVIGGGGRAVGLGDNRRPDHSGSYSTYTYGDPATPMMRSYLGEPTKTRLMNAGGERAHVHHLHGGATRWLRNPETGPDDFFSSGFSKTPTDSAEAGSITLDSQTIGPGESYNLEHQCGAGGCQQVAGDFLFHCHIAHHYFAGMWSMWRVFDTKQAGLAELPDRRGEIPAAVTSEELVGKTIEGRTIVADDESADADDEVSVSEWVESQLPPPGERSGWDDAAVWDWTWDGNRALGEPEYNDDSDPDEDGSAGSWANYTSATPGERPPIRFNPENGRYAWPLLQPHLGMRPPFAPNGHDGSPWTGARASEERPDGLCPRNAPLKTYNITAITLPIKQSNGASGHVDSAGEIYVLNEDKDAVLNGDKPPEPLVIRSNVGDCVELTLSSELVDNFANRNYSKVNIHSHFIQFDPQASDGNVTGASFEQSVRPYAREASQTAGDGRTLVTEASAGDRRITVVDGDQLREGVSIAVGQGKPNIEVREIVKIEGSDASVGGVGTPAVITLDEPLEKDHAAGEAAGVEFAHYRWYSDVDSGTVFWHDHVLGHLSWKHGLFGAHVIEPPGSTYHDPRTGRETRSGAIADIHTPPDASVGAGQQGSFREFVAFLHADASIAAETRDQTDPEQNVTSGRDVISADSGPGTINLRAEPVNERGGRGDPHVFSSTKWGDPFTPLPRAYVGDPFLVRTIGVMQLEGSLRITGHRFSPERFSDGVEPVDANTTGISERFDYILEGGAGGPAKQAGDYLYYSGIQRDFDSGAWGLIRVHDSPQNDLNPLPGRPLPTRPDGSLPALPVGTGRAPQPAAGSGNPCPESAPMRSYDLAAFAKPLPLSDNREGGRRRDTQGVMYALERDRAAIVAGDKPLEPLAIRANAGDCIEITLRNHLDSRRAGLNIGKVLYDPRGSGGSAIGQNPDSTVAPGEARQYRFYADRELGTSLMLDLAGTSKLLHGAYGALIVEPRGSTYLSSATGQPDPSGAGLEAIVRTPRGSFREFVALLHDSDVNIGNDDTEYLQEVQGFTGLNYQAAPFAQRLAENADPSRVFDSRVHGPAATGQMRAYAGDPVRFRVGVPAGQQLHSFAIDGHQWRLDPGLRRSETIGARSILPGQSLDIRTTAGGRQRAAGEYVYGDRRMPFTQAGLWSVFEVFDRRRPDLAPLPRSRRGRR